jgi:hypothetical protein
MTCNRTGVAFEATREGRLSCTVSRGTKDSRCAYASVGPNRSRLRKDPKDDADDRADQPLDSLVAESSLPIKHDVASAQSSFAGAVAPSLRDDPARPRLHASAHDGEGELRD